MAFFFTSALPNPITPLIFLITVFKLFIFDFFKIAYTNPNAIVDWLFNFEIHFVFEWIQRGFNHNNVVFTWIDFSYTVKSGVYSDSFVLRLISIVFLTFFVCFWHEINQLMFVFLWKVMLNDLWFTLDFFLEFKITPQLNDQYYLSSRIDLHRVSVVWFRSKFTCLRIVQSYVSSFY